MSEVTTEKLAFVLVLLVALICLAILGDDPQHLEDNYCQMVSIYKKSDGEFGWPDYKGNYAEVCDVE